jgi:signal transduction histidine kinase
MATDLEEHADIRIGVRTSGSPYPLGAVVEKNVFRIAQEAVANAIRHAAARQISIEVRFDRHQAHMTITDDGRGFDQTAASGGFGLTSMRQRAEQIGATLRLESGPPAGTSVSVTVSVAPPARRPVMARAAALACAIRQLAPRLPNVVQSGFRAFRAVAGSLQSLSSGDGNTTETRHRK